MIDRMSPYSVIHVPNTLKTIELRAWCEHRGLRNGSDFFFYGSSSLPGKVSWAFTNKDDAMVFKLTFG